MLNLLDDFPIHQTPEPLAHAATSDRNVYDRFWFNGYVADGSYYFGVAMGLYPHRGVLDCGFSVVRQGGLQHCFFGSRRAPPERTEMTVGPFRLEVVQPMLRTRIILDDNESGLACDLTFSTRTTPIQEARQTLWSGSRRVMDATRFDQFGRWSGVIRTPEGEITVSDQACFGTKDRSWGARKVGEAEIGGAPPQAVGGAFFLWAPLFWEDHASNAIFFDGVRGEPLIREGFTAPLHAEESPSLAHEGPDERMATVKHRIAYWPGTRLARSAEIDFIDHADGKRTQALEPLLKFQMKGIGYGHPQWGHGMWKGELAVGSETFDPKTLDMLSPENIHVQQVVRASDDAGRTGTGVLEQVCAGPYAPAGFTQMFDGAKG
jgi:hypothetical protein